MIIFYSPLMSTTVVVARERALPQLPPPCDVSSQSSSSLPPCRSGCRFSALAAHSWPLRSPSAAARRWCYLPNEELPPGTTAIRGPHLQAPVQKVQIQFRIQPHHIGRHVFYPFSSSLLLLHIDVLMKLQFIFFSGTLQVEYGSLTVMHVAVLIIVMVLA
jgi:hypothetical protein